MIIECPWHVSIRVIATGLYRPSENQPHGYTSCVGNRRSDDPNLGNRLVAVVTELFGSRHLGGNEFMALSITQVDAFTSVPFTGNPAVPAPAVVRAAMPRCRGSRRPNRAIISGGQAVAEVSFGRIGTQVLNWKDREPELARHGISEAWSWTEQ